MVVDYRCAGGTGIAGPAAGCAWMECVAVDTDPGSQRPVALAPADAAVIERFADALWMERGLSANTLSSYQSDLRHCARWLRVNPGCELLRVRRDCLLGYLAAGVEEGVGPRTSARRLSTLRQFFQWALREQLLQRDPTAQIEAPRLGRPLPKSLSEREVEALLEAPDAQTAVVTLAHDPKIDDPALAAALGSEAFYIGALGSRRTHARRVERLTELGLAGQVEALDEARSAAESALRQRDRELQLAQSMARVASWTGYPLEGTFELTQGAGHIDNTLEGVRTWTQFMSLVHPEDRRDVTVAWRRGRDGWHLDVEFRLLFPGRRHNRRLDHVLR